MSNRIHTIQSSNPEELDQIVNEYLDLGWQLVNNGYSTKGKDEDIMYLQVVSWNTKENEDVIMAFYPNGKLKHFQKKEKILKQWYENRKIMLEGKLYYWDHSNPYKLLPDFRHFSRFDFFDIGGKNYKGIMKQVGINRESCIIPDNEMENSSYLFWGTNNRMRKGQGPFITIYRHVEFKNGYRHGKYTRFYSNGQKRSKGTYKDGGRNGLWTDWDENGTIKEVRKF